MPEGSLSPLGWDTIAHTRNSAHNWKLWLALVGMISTLLCGLSADIPSLLWVSHVTASAPPLAATGVMMPPVGSRVASPHAWHTTLRPLANEFNAEQSNTEGPAFSSNSEDYDVPSETENPTTSPSPISSWWNLVTGVPYLLVALGGLSRLWHSQPWIHYTAAEGEVDPVLQMRTSFGMKRGGGYGGRKKQTAFSVVTDNVKRVWAWFVRTGKGFMRWVRNSPIDVIMLLIFLCSWALWLNPALEYVFLIQGFRHPLAFLMSGFSCFNIYQLYSDIFYVYILGKAYCIEFSPRELAILYGGGTLMGSLLVALTPGGWMGPTAGTAALLTAFMLRYPGTPMAIPMIPLIFFPFQVRWIGTILALANFYLFSKGVASGAAFTGGVLFALLLKPRRELKVQEISLSY